MITKTEEIMATAFNDDGDLSWEEMNNARKELLRRLEEGEKAEEAMKNIKAVLKSTSSMRIDIINNISEAYQNSKA